jgi:hypothetical protein
MTRITAGFTPKHYCAPISGNASREVAEMIRELFMAFVLLSLTVAAVAWYSGGSRLSVQQVEASLAPSP